MPLKQEGRGLPLKRIKTCRVGVDQGNEKDEHISNGSSAAYRKLGKREKLWLWTVVLWTVALSVRCSVVGWLLSLLLLAGKGRCASMTKDIAIKPIWLQFIS